MPSWHSWRRDLCAKSAIEEHEEKVYKLKKTLYGLKQSPRDGYIITDSYMISNEPTLYTMVNQHGQIFIVCLYVDDVGNL